MKTVEVCIFIYGNKSEKCLNFLPGLDYPRELLKVTVFSDRPIEHQYKHLIISEKEAYHSIAMNAAADYIWIIKADYIITNPATLIECIKEDCDIVSAMLTKENSVFANFWGKVSETGWYARSDDYLDIFNRKKTGIFIVPYVTGNILFKTAVFKRNLKLTEEHDDWDIDMNICANLRRNNELLFLLNKSVYGHIEETNINKDQNVLGPWTEETYLHKDFLDFMKQYYADRDNISTSIFKEIGPDIWQLPIFTPAFCDFLVDVAEKKNEWSGGTVVDAQKIDKRIGAVENYPTQDIHLTQLNLNHWWMDSVVKKYFKAILYHLYRYNTKGYNISFIVKYSIDGQKKLDPHHDASAYTTNIALNSYGVDYTGGGCNFIHKKVVCVGNPKGHMTLHPGRITHYHEAIQIESGKRYILVSFNN